MVERRNRFDGERADPQLLTRRNFDDVVTAWSQQMAEPRWNDDPRSPAETPEGREVQMIVMRVRDEHDVDVGLLEKALDLAGMAMQRSEPVDEQWIGENADAVELEQDGRVTQETEHGRRDAHP